MATALHTPIPDGSSGPFMRKRHATATPEGAGYVYDARCDACKAGRERIFVADGVNIADRADGGRIAGVARERKLAEVKAYLWAGWEFECFGSAPKVGYASMLGTGFYFVRTDDSSGPGFGAHELLARLHSGLHFGVDVTGMAV